MQDLEYKWTLREIRKALSSGKLLTLTNLLQRGWTADKAYSQLPKPIYYKEPNFEHSAPVLLWTLEAVEQAEADIAFYLE